MKEIVPAIALMSGFTVGIFLVLVLISYYLMRIMDALERISRRVK